MVTLIGEAIQAISRAAGGSGESYLMVLLVLRRIHWGMGRFCFCARASFCLVRKDFWDCSECQSYSSDVFLSAVGIFVPAS
jgi:hypothetical protein